MPFIYYKTPDEIERIGINFENRLASGESIASGTEVITDKDGKDVTATLMVGGSENISDEDGDGNNDTVTIRVQSGTLKQNYKLVIQGTTSTGDKKEEIIIIKVREISIA